MLLGVAKTYEVIEVRDVGEKYQAGCVRRVQFLDGSKLHGEKFSWFELHDDYLETLDAAKEFCGKYVSGYMEAEEEHRQAGIDHYREELEGQTI